MHNTVSPKLIAGMAHRRFIISLVLSLCIALSVPANVFISIDCGSSIPYRDRNGIGWVGDAEYVQSGESRSVDPSSPRSHVADTLRVFPTRNKNCYYIDSVKEGRVLVLATFYYGNYDGRDSPPTFALQFDGNDWAQVVTSSTEYYYYEVTYVMKIGSISVCVAQTEPEQFPFITTLEIRSLESFMYDHVDSGYPLFHRTRVAFASIKTISYPDDPYDRLWAPADYGNGSISVTSDALMSGFASPDDSPPPAVLKHAITATALNASLDLLMGFPSYQIPVHINWYFSEVTQLEPNQTRSFRIFMDDESISEPILPPYENCTQLYISNITVSSNTTFSLVATNDSTLPPLINAMEVFRIGERLTDGTSKRDIEGLASLKNGFSVLKNWSGDPCLPTNYTWDWIQCNDDPTPRVTALLLGGYGLSGLLPNFSSMDALQTIDLHNNSLRGPIPDFLGTLPNLQILNLGNNQFNGTTPASLSRNGLNLTVAGNPDLCTSSCQIPPPANSSFKKKNILELLFGVLISSIIIL